MRSSLVFLGYMTVDSNRSLYFSNGTRNHSPALVPVIPILEPHVMCQHRIRIAIREVQDLSHSTVFAIVTMINNFNIFMQRLCKALAMPNTIKDKEDTVKYHDCFIHVRVSSMNSKCSIARIRKACAPLVCYNCTRFPKRLNCRYDVGINRVTGRGSCIGNH
jgi:hypothetical protein